MKNTIKFLAVVIFAITTISNLNAQTTDDGARLKLGFGVSLGTTTQKSPFGYGLGFDVHLKYSLSDELAFTGAVGYTRLLTKDTSPIADYDFIPLTGTIKIFPTQEKIYLMALVGAGFGIRQGAKTALIFGGGIGYEWNSKFELSARYEGYQQNKISSTYQPLNGQFALSLGYNLNL